MGREIRRVPPNWEHPEKNNGEYIPQCEESYETAAERWKDGYEKWKTEPEEGYEHCDFWEWDRPPEREDHVDYEGAEPTWYQVYETVSEGTPLTPPFETKEDLVDYLATHGTFWGGSYSRETAEKFVNAGWVPTGVMVAGKGFYEGIDAVNVLSGCAEEPTP